MQENYSVGLYCRLSQDDGVQNANGKAIDSSSIKTQKMILEKYCKENNFSIYSTYTDDGYSGLNFNRPSFQRMINDIEDGKINMVITKDLSRMGRDYIQCGYYTEIYFPSKGVRYIAINDGIDTDKDNNDLAPFKNILNDMYAKDLSRKVRSAIRHRAMQGFFVGSNAPFGYLKDPNNKNKLIIDNETAPVVKRIFDLILSGYGTIDIAKLLKKDKVLTPAATKVIKGDTRFQRHVKGGYEYGWTDGCVYNIITNPVYTGDMVNAKTRIVNYKTKKSVANSKDKYIIVPNTHEAIISKDDFERVQLLCKERHTSRKKFDIDNLFRGLVKCSVCCSSMVLTTQMRRGKLMAYYRCNAFTSYRVNEKHWTTIKYDDLKEIVITRLKELFSLFKNDESLIKMIKSKIKDTNVTIDYDKELNKVELRKTTLSNITKKVYDDYFEGLINEETYLDLIKKYQSEQNDLKDKSDLLLKEKNSKSNTLEDTVNSFLEVKELKKEIVYNLIDKIEITNIGGYKQHKQREVNITYRFKIPQE